MGATDFVLRFFCHSILVALVVKPLATPISASDHVINGVRKLSAWKPWHGNPRNPNEVLPSSSILFFVD